MASDDLPPAPRLPVRDLRAPRSTHKRALSKEAIATTALAIVDTDGLDALTMRTVAKALGTGPASLYAYVSSKEELLELVVERVIGEMRIGGEPDPERWQEQVKAFGREVRAVFTSHGDVARASFARIPLGENALRINEWLIAVLQAGGLPDQVIAFACDLLPMYIVAVAYEESLFLREGSTPEDFAVYAAEMRDYFAALPVDRFPHVVALAGPLTAGEDDDRFEFGMDVLVRGLAAMK